MADYRELLSSYRRRQRDTVVDTLAAGLTYMDEICVESGVLEETGLLTELAGGFCSALPFALIAATEGTKVILGRKPTKTGVKDGAYRMVKTGAAIGVGAAVTAAVGFWAAIPATMGVRALFDRYKSRALTGIRVQQRTDRLKELNLALRGQEEAQPEAETAAVRPYVTTAVGTVE